MASAAVAMTVAARPDPRSTCWRKGLEGLTFQFFTQTQEFAGPLSSATTGGAAHAIVGTLEQVGLAVMMSVPLGLMCAVFLNEIGGPLERPVRVFVDAMSGVPTIVAGIFIYSIWVFEFGFSGFAAALAISISMLPIITRTSEEVLRLVPQGLREASLALGTSEWRTVWSVVLPTGHSGLITAVILGVARAIGETAPLIATTFGAAVMNANPFQGPQEALPLFIFKLLTESAQGNVIAKAWTGCLVLMLMVLVLFTIARLVERPARPSTPGACCEGETDEHGPEPIPVTRTAGVEPPSPNDFVAEGVSAWFGDHKVLERVSLACRRPGDRPHRAVGLRQVDLSARSSTGCTSRARRRARRRGVPRRRGHLRRRAAAHRGPAAHRNGVPEAEPVPGHEHRRERPVGLEAVGQAGRANDAVVEDCLAARGCGTR